MSAIEKALKEILFEIPREVLEETFKDESLYTSSRRSGPKISLEARIREDVLEDRVLEDCGLLGGHEITVPLAGLSLVQHNDNAFTVTIPRDRTDNGDITSVLGIYQSPMYHGAHHLVNSGPRTQHNQLQSGMFDSIRGYSDLTMVEGRVKTLLDNTVYVILNSAHHEDLWLRCRVSNDPYLSMLPRPYYHDFAQLAIYATQAHVYRKLRFKVGEGRLSGGVSLGEFKETIDEYRDSNQLYKDFLKDNWQQVSALTDMERHNKAIQVQFGGYR